MSPGEQQKYLEFKKRLVSFNCGIISQGEGEEEVFGINLVARGSWHQKQHLGVLDVTVGMLGQ